jgi:hypothetical protein
MDGRLKTLLEDLEANGLIILKWIIKTQGIWA